MEQIQQHKNKTEVEKLVANFIFNIFRFIIRTCNFINLKNRTYLHSYFKRTISKRKKENSLHTVSLKVFPTGIH